MKSKKPGSLLIEWSPGAVRVIDVARGRQAEGATLADVAEVTAEHREAIVGIGRDACFLNAVHLPKAAREDLRRILAVRIGEIFPLPADQLAFDFRQSEEAGAEGHRTVVAAMRADDLRRLHEELRQAGLTAPTILPVALGSAVAAKRAGLRDALTLEQNSRGLAADLVQGGMLRLSRMAPPGQDLLSEARRTLAAFGSGGEELLTLGGLTLEGAAYRRESALELLPEAGWSGFELAEERAQAMKRRVAMQTRFALLLALSALLLVVLVWVDRNDARAVIQRGQGTWARELSRLRSIRDTEIKKGQKAGEQEMALKWAFEPGQSLSDVAAVVSDSLPRDSWLTGLTLERGKPLQIRATTTSPDDVTRLLRNLAETGRFREIRLLFANSGRISETEVVQYSVSAVAIGNLPLPEPQRNSSRKTNNLPGKTSEAKEPTGQ